MEMLEEVLASSVEHSDKRPVIPSSADDVDDDEDDVDFNPLLQLSPASSESEEDSDEGSDEEDESLAWSEDDDYEEDEFGEDSDEKDSKTEEGQAQTGKSGLPKEGKIIKQKDAAEDIGRKLREGGTPEQGGSAAEQLEQVEGTAHVPGVESEAWENGQEQMLSALQEKDASLDREPRSPGGVNSAAVNRPLAITDAQLLELSSNGLDNIPIGKRTRAHLSLEGMSLDQLEAFLQHSDEEDFFPNVDDEEGYRKFLAAVMGPEDQAGLIADQEDEDDDDDFQIDDEALGLESESYREQSKPRGRNKRPRREKKKEGAIGQGGRLRPLVPYASSPLHKSLVRGGIGRPHIVHREARIGFSPEQLAQLYGQVYEHVQLLIQVHTLTALEPAQQDLAGSIAKLLTELSARREEAISSATSMFPISYFQFPFSCSSISPHSPGKVHAAPGQKKRNGGTGERGWEPAMEAPVRSVLEVAPLAKLGSYIAEIEQAVQKHEEDIRENPDGPVSVPWSERVPLFGTPSPVAQSPGKSTAGGPENRHDVTGNSPRQLAEVPGQLRPRVNSTGTSGRGGKGPKLALVIPAAARAIQPFAKLFNPALYPLKPPLEGSKRPIFTAAEDRLLAMGVQVFNANWQAIHERFLPAKTPHQIFVRHKNCIAARMPDNPIKAVRQRKLEPLTEHEKVCINEALKVHHMSWNEVWRHYLPHRDPVHLPRLWRVASGLPPRTRQAEASLIRRRARRLQTRGQLAEGSRPQSHGAARLSAEDTAEEGWQEVEGAGPSEEDAGGVSDNEHPEDRYMRTAFVSASTSPSRLSQPPRAPFLVRPQSVPRNGFATPQANGYPSADSAPDRDVSGATSGHRAESPSMLTGSVPSGSALLRQMATNQMSAPVFHPSPSRHSGSVPVHAHPLRPSSGLPPVSSPSYFPGSPAPGTGPALRRSPAPSMPSIPSFPPTSHRPQTLPSVPAAQPIPSSSLHSSQPGGSRLKKKKPGRPVVKDLPPIVMPDGRVIRLRREDAPTLEPRALRGQVPPPMHEAQAAPNLLRGSGTGRTPAPGPAAAPRSVPTGPPVVAAPAAIPEASSMASDALGRLPQREQRSLRSQELHPRDMVPERLQPLLFGDYSLDVRLEDNLLNHADPGGVRHSQQQEQQRQVAGPSTFGGASLHRYALAGQGRGQREMAQPRRAVGAVRAALPDRGLGSQPRRQGFGSEAFAARQHPIRDQLRRAEEHDPGLSVMRQPQALQAHEFRSRGQALQQERSGGMARPGSEGSRPDFDLNVAYWDAQTGGNHGSHVLYGRAEDGGEGTGGQGQLEEEIEMEREELSDSDEDGPSAGRQSGETERQNGGESGSGSQAPEPRDCSTGPTDGVSGVSGQAPSGAYQGLDSRREPTAGTGRPDSEDGREAGPDEQVEFECEEMADSDEEEAAGRLLSASGDQVASHITFEEEEICSDEEDEAGNR